MFKKPITFYAAWADIVSGVVIVLTLIYAVVEFNRTKSADLSQDTSVLYDHELQVKTLLATSPGLAELVVKAENGLDNLTKAERVKYINFTALLFANWSRAIDLRTVGTFEEQYWVGWNEYFTTVAKSYPLFAWEENRPLFPNPRFRVIVDEVMGYKPSE